MKYNYWKEMSKNLFKFCTTVIALTLIMVGSSLAEANMVSVDSVKAGPGQDVPLRFYIQNENDLSSITIPITYDPALLTIKDIDFSGSQGEHIATKLQSPSDIDSINGHFLVSFIQLFEDPIPAGDGLIMTVLFHVSDTVTGRLTTIIDTLFYAPSNDLLFVESGSANNSFTPEFKAGIIVIDALNKAPLFHAVSSQYLHEGDSLNLDIKVEDPNGDVIRLVNTSAPDGATFVDNGDGTGTLRWAAQYVGPGSSDNSPVKLQFWATDGDLSDRLEIELQVLNRNRPPLVEFSAPLEINAGETFEILFSAEEPDFEEIEWTFNGFPENIDINREAGKIVWPSSVIDTGLFQFDLIATDPHGMSDTAVVELSVLAIDLYTLSFDTVSAFPNANIDVAIKLDNKLPVSSFSLLLHYDPLALTLLDVITNGTRSEQFEYFSFTDNVDNLAGNVRVDAIGDLSGNSEFYYPGEGSIAKMRFHIVNNVTMSGVSVPLQFIFEDSVNWDDNILTDTSENILGHNEIAYQNGYVHILEVGLIVKGDINLNGLAYEIGDAIYFGNYFMSPTEFPFDVVQYANSDVNNDGVPATIADLIALINTIVNGTSYTKPLTESNSPKAVLYANEVDGQLLLSYETNFEIGGLLVTLDGEHDIVSSDVRLEESRMDFLSASNTDATRILIWSVEGNVLRSGEQLLGRIDNVSDFTSGSVQFATSTGELVLASLVTGQSSLPNSAELNQNYPNPFNPETTIGFELSHSGEVELVVFNVLGRKVNVLINKFLPAGSHDVLWNGRDESGQTVASGIYFYRLTTGEFTKTRKMTLLK